MRFAPQAKRTDSRGVSHDPSYATKRDRIVRVNPEKVLKSTKSGTRRFHVCGSHSVGIFVAEMRTNVIYNIGNLLIAQF